MAETVATIPGLSEPFSLKGWDVTALGIAQGNRVEAAPMCFCCLSALKGRHGPSRPFRAERRKRTAVGRLTTQGVALGCYVPALRAERMKTSRDWSLVGPVVLLQSRKSPWFCRAGLRHYLFPMRPRRMTVWGRTLIRRYKTTCSKCRAENPRRPAGTCRGRAGLIEHASTACSFSVRGFSERSCS